MLHNTHEALPTWPLTKLSPPPHSNDPGCILITTGAMNPVHGGHVAMMHAAATRLRAAGYHVCGAYLSPSHDGYVQPKADWLHTVGLSAGFRLEVARRAVAADPLVDVSSWEASQPGNSWPDFPVVCAAAAADPGLVPFGRVFYVCGSDHASKCGLDRSQVRAFGVVIVPRTGDAVRPEAPNQRDILVAATAPGGVGAFSSTMLREALREKDEPTVAAIVSPAAAAFILRPRADELAMYASDFAKLQRSAESESESE
jgi:nicotinic acid mononucleotide adenylyltransferase